LGSRVQGSGVIRVQSPGFRVPGSSVQAVRSKTLLEQKNEIGRDWYGSHIGRDIGAKVKMCNAVHGLSGFSAIEQTGSQMYRSKHFHFCPSNSSNFASVPISSALLK